MTTIGLKVEGGWVLQSAKLMDAHNDIQLEVALSEDQLRTVCSDI